MRKPFRGVWESLNKRYSSGRGNRRGSPCVRPFLESLENRETPSVSTVAANSVISGFVFAGGGQSGVPGVNVMLTGSTTTGRTINVSTTTDANGAYTFNSVLPGTYNVTRSGQPNGFVGGNISIVSNVAVGEGQTVASNNLNVGGLASSRVSLASFLSDSVGTRGLPPAGVGAAAAFTLDRLINPLSNAQVGVGTTNFVDLASNFFDPDTTDTTLTFDVTYSEGNNTPVQGQIQVQLFDTDAPATVTNFLDYIESGAYQNDLFHRIANLSTGNTGVAQILQAGGFAVNLDGSTPPNITTISPLKTTFQPIASEFSAAHQNAAGTIAMALSTGPNSATNEFYFNLTDNSSTLGSSNPSGPFTVFGHIVGSMTDVNNIANRNNYVPTDLSNTTNFPNSNAAFASLPLSTALGTPPTAGATFPVGSPATDVPMIKSVTVTTPSQGHLTYAIVGNTNPGAFTVTLGANTANSTFSANQLKIVSHTAGSSVITLQITDARGEVVTRQFTVSAH
jgi:cyclophilin family peptidyl-prolyl cis-trans isomerase